MVKRTVYFVLLLFVLADVGFSFLQHLSAPLDGDIAESLVPIPKMKPLFIDPLGIGVITQHKSYPNPNRFFSHWIFQKYLRKTPLLIQSFTDPVNSVYIACAIAKTLIQIGLILILTFVITGTMNIRRLEFIIAATLITPLFQTHGYRSYMGIIDPSVTYTFFYAFPLLLLLIYFLPFIQQSFLNKISSIHFLLYIIWIPFGLVVCLSGPLNPGIVLIFSMLVVLQKIIKTYIHDDHQGLISKILHTFRSVPGHYWLFLIPVCLFSLYSLYLGQFNLHDNAYPIALAELYSKLPHGLYYLFTQKLGFPILFVILTINSVLIAKKYNSPEGKRILRLFKWIGIFVLLYIVLLPLGGYRGYRPYILRYDTIMPVTISLIFIFGSTTWYLLKSIASRYRIMYYLLITGVLLIYTLEDTADFDNNKCEKEALTEISRSKESVVKLQCDCTLIAWDKMQTPEDSEWNSELLLMWKITDEKKLFYQY